MCFEVLTLQGRLIAYSQIDRGWCYTCQEGITIAHRLNDVSADGGPDVYFMRLMLVMNARIRSHGKEYAMASQYVKKVT